MNGLSRRVPGFLFGLLILFSAGLLFAQDSTDIRLLEQVQSWDSFSHVVTCGSYHYVAARHSGLLVLEQQGDEFEICYHMTWQNVDAHGVYLDRNNLIVTGPGQKAFFLVNDPANPQPVSLFTIEPPAPRPNEYQYGVTHYYRDNVRHREVLLHHSKETYANMIFVEEIPEMLARLTTADSVDFSGVYFTDSLIYASSWDSLLYVWNFSNIDSIVLEVDGLPMGHRFDCIDVQDSLLLASEEEENLFLYDISAPGTPILLSTLSAEDIGHPCLLNPVLVDSKAVVFGCDQAYQLSISEDGGLGLLDSVYVGSYFYRNPCVESGQIAWTENYDGLATLNVLEEPPYGAFERFDPVEFYWGGMLYCDDTILCSNLEVRSTNQPDQWDSLGVLVNPEGKRGTLTASGPDMALVEFGRDYHIVTRDLDTPSGFAVRGELPDTYPSGYNFSQNGWLFSFWQESASTFIVRSYNTTNPDFPVVAATTEFPGVMDFFRSTYDNHIYFCGGRAGQQHSVLFIVDVSTPQDLECTSINLDYYARVIMIKESYLFLQNENSSEFLVYSLENPETPELLTSFSTDVTRIFDYHYPYLAAFRSNELVILQYNPEDNSQPDELYTFNLSGLEALLPFTNPTNEKAAWFLNDNLLYVTWETGMGLFEHGESGITPLLGNALPAKIQLSTFPNPANPDARITLDLPEMRDVSVTVFNLLGQEVAHLYEGQLTSGQHVFHFGMNKNISGGVYFVNVKAGSESQTKKIVIVK